MSRGPASVLDPDFRRQLAEWDEPETAGEAEWAGPWKVELVDRHWAVLRQWESRDLGHEPEALFSARFHAEVCAVLLPAAARGSELTLGADREAAGYPVLAHSSRGHRPIGWLRHATAEILEALQAAEVLRRSPVALAHLLLSTGPSGVDQVGQILAQWVAAGRKGGCERS